MATANLLQQKLSILTPHLIDPSKCTSGTSLHQQILKNSQNILKSQQRKFNLGNGHIFTDPLIAADHLLQREYGGLYVPNHRGSVIIPQVFNSIQYAKDSTVHLLDYDIGIATIENTLVNLTREQPKNWFTKEIKAFCNANVQQNNSNKDIDKREFDKWILNCKVMYLTINEIGTETLNLPLTTSETDIFVKACLAELGSNCLGSVLENKLQNGLLKLPTITKLRSNVEKLIKTSPPTDPTITWYFELTLSELGEKAEHWFFNQFLTLQQDEILNNTVILQSITFMTNVRKKHHQEFDFLLISWPRKLIIAVEIKRQLLTATAFIQLEKYKQIFDEKLADQLDNGWTFLPVICVERNTHNLSLSQHYITFETDIKSWLSNVFLQYPALPCLIPFTSPLDQMKNMLKMIVFTIHASKIAPVICSNWVEYTSKAIESISTVENIAFYSKTQMHVMNQNEPRLQRLLIRGGYGTGKSFLLEEKAKQLSRDPNYTGRIVYVCWHSQPTSLLEWLLKLELEDNHGVIVMGLSFNNEEETQNLLSQMIIQHNVKVLLFDEWKNEYKRLFSWIQEEWVSKHVEFIWIALQGENFQSHKVTQQFALLDLSLNFRNSRELVKEAKAVAVEKSYKYKERLVMPPPLFPSGCPPIYVDSFELAVKEMRKLTQSGILVIADTRTDGQHWEDHTRILDSMNEQWRRYDFTDNDFKPSENPYQYLSNNNILLTDCLFIQGFEWINVISFREGSNSADFHDCNYFMRCTTNLVIVKD